MRFKEMPTAENFIWTNKKKKIITAFMREFCFSRRYEIFCGHIPGPQDLADFLRQRLPFIRNIECLYAIRTETDDLGKIFKGVHFQYQNNLIQVFNNNLKQQENEAYK